MPSKTLSALLSTVLWVLAIPATGQNTGLIQPNSITLGPSQPQQFLLNGTNQGIVWSILPTNLGVITSTGLYTAPASESSRNVVFIYAQPVGSSSIYMTPIYLSPTPLSMSQTGSSNTNPTNPTNPANPATPTSPVPQSPTPSTPSSVQGSSATNQNPNPTPSQPQTTSSSSLNSPSAISVSISPASTYIHAGQAAQFTAVVQGTLNQQVQWSIAQGVGSISNGMYLAPASFGSDSLVTIAATSVVDPTKTATATVLLGQTIAVAAPTNPSPSVAISIGPGSMSLAAGQSAQFEAAVTGTTNTGVTWSLSPNVGTVVNGLYTAPGSLTSNQTIELIATSVADPTKRAAVSLTLKPVSNPTTSAVILGLSPTSASLTGGQRATFTATVSGTTNTGVTWSWSPQVGTISNGVYMAPATISSQQTVRVTATSVADPDKNRQCDSNAATASTSAGYRSNGHAGFGFPCREPVRYLHRRSDWDQ